MKTWARAALGLLLLLACGGPLLAQGDFDRLRSAKALFFDRKYVEARQAWQAIQSGGGSDAASAPYWIARCSESLGENERALAEYGDYLDKRPADRALAEEARTSRVGLAAKLYKAGRKQYLSVLTQALSDSSKTVRYFAAFQLASLGKDVGQPAVPVLQKILAEEKDEDLLDRARLFLIKLDPDALAHAPGRSVPAKEAGWLKVRIYAKGQPTPKVSINLPVALAELVFKSLPDDTSRELKRKGYDADNFWEKLKKLGPTQILEIIGDDGERVQIWIE